MKISPLGVFVFALMCGPGGVALPSHILAARESASVPSEPESGRPYLVIPETTSPNEQYAIAWMLPRGPQIDFEKFRTGERNSDYLPDFANPRSDIEDNLVALKSGRKLATVALGYWALPEGNHSPGLKFRPDNEFMEVAWSPSSDFVLVLHHWRFGPEGDSLRAFRLEIGAVVSQVECGSDLEVALRAFLKKRHGQEYERVKGDPNLRFSDLKSLGGSRFSLNGIAKLQNPYGNGIYRGATFKFELRPGKEGKLSLRVLGFTEVDLDEAS